MDKQKMIKLLEDCAEELYNQEYNSWYNASTMRSFEEWRCETIRGLISSCRSTITELESEDSFDPTSYCEKTHHECEAPEICKATKACMRA